MSDMRPFYKTVAVVTAFFLFIVSSRIQAVAVEVARNGAIVTLTGSATINNAPAFSGQTLFAKNTITTTKSSSLTLDVPRATRLEVSEQTELRVEVLADLLRTELETGRVSLSTAQGTTTRVEIFPGLSVVSDPTMPAKFMVAVKDTTFELRVSEGAVDVVDSRETNQQVTHVGPNMTFSNAGLLQPNNAQSNLTTGQRVAIIVAAGGALALIIAILTGDDPAADGPGGCVIAPSGQSPQNPC